MNSRKNKLAPYKHQGIANTCNGSTISHHKGEQVHRNIFLIDKVAQKNRINRQCI